LKKYKVKEAFYTLQGEGFHSGRAAVFCRFTGCNLWSGREEDRSDAVCYFCDTDFIGTDGQNGGTYTAEELSKLIIHLGGFAESTFVVCTGGEPALQLDQNLVDVFHENKIEIAIETNGTKPLPIGIDWICVSPKENAEVIIQNGDELKLVYPQKFNKPQDFENFDFKNFYIQPLDNEFQNQHIAQCVNFCLENPKWKLSLQTHKILGID
jgi:7-carboxy-7-deazaguanine synthase